MATQAVVGFVLLYLTIQGVSADRMFRAAVLDTGPLSPYTNSSVPSRQEALNIVQPQLDLFVEKTKEAKDKGVDIIVFAEYGLFPFGLTRESIYPFLEQVPSAKEEWTPKGKISDNKGREILYSLSSMARIHGIYLVANVGDKVFCTQTTDPHCPPDGRYQYNTNVAFDPTGKLVARYHKKNLFFEFHYDTPLHTDLSYFDTPFGRIGTFVCFDVVFHEPAIDLIEKYNITTVAFPTAWMNVLPYFAAVPFHSAFARGMGVNYLASNIHNPTRRFLGSGIYTSNNVVAFRNDRLSQASHLVVGDLPVQPVKNKRKKVKFNSVTTNQSAEFHNTIFGDEWTFRALDKQKDAITVCKNQLCCHLAYERDTSDSLFALGVFRGLHTLEGTYYLEMCGLMKCNGSTADTCGQAVIESDSFFPFFNLTGNFSTNYVFPMVITSGLNPSPGDQWSYDGRSTTSNHTDQGLVSAIQFGRRYDYDTSGASTNMVNTMSVFQAICSKILLCVMSISYLGF